MEPQFHSMGDQALLVTLSHGVSAEVNDRVLRLCRTIERAAIPGVSEIQPAYSAFCIHFDPSMTRMSYIETLVKRLMEAEEEDEKEGGESGTGSKEPQALKPVEIPVIYGGVEGPDLDWSARYLGMSPEELIERHTSPTYRVFMIGFTPGFPYLGGMDEDIALPRLPEPRPRVAAGSVGIGGSQTGVYPWDTPGGWRILGRTEAVLFSPYRDGPSLLRPGDSVRFVPVRRTATVVDAPHPGATGVTTAPGPAGALDPGSSSLHPCMPGSSTDDFCTLSLPGLLVEHPGFFTLVVDQGRFGYRKIGVPVSGAADLRSYRLANRICLNLGSAAALEMTLLGGKFRALIDLSVAVTGAPAPVHIDGREIPMNAPVFLPKGSLLEVGSVSVGSRSYLAVAGGISAPLVMGSRSTYVRGGFGGHEGRFLKAGDILSCGPAPEHRFIAAGAERGARASIRQPPGQPAGYLSGSSGSVDRNEPWDGPAVLRVLAGPEAEPHLLEALCRGEYTVNPESDRMGLRLTGASVPVGKGDILSSPVVPGTIQVPSDGKPLLLLCDGQTTGGYKRVAVVVSTDLWRAGQLRPGSKVVFRLISAGSPG